MSDIPASLKWGTVEGLFGSVGTDTADAQRVPDVTLLAGTVTFTPSVSWIQVPEEGTFYLEAVTAVLTGGVLFPPEDPATPGVPLVATFQPGSIPEVVQWTATFLLDDVSVQLRPVLFNVPAGGATHLSTQMGAEELVPYVVVVSAEDSESAQSSADVAGAAAAVAQAARTTAQSAAGNASSSATAAAQSAAAAAAAQAALSGALARLPYAVSQGLVAITPSAANTPTAVSVTFPVGRFTVAPHVQVTARSGTVGTQVTGVGSSGSSASGVSIYLTRTNTTETNVVWLATQMTVAAANG